MGLSCGIVGLPNVGKSTLFNLLTSANAVAENYPFCTIKPNVGIANIPDHRLKRLADLSGSRKIVPSTLEVVDIAGLVKGASQGEGLGNEFLGQIRNVDAIVHLIRLFDDENVSHVLGEVNPHADLDIIKTELILKDIETVDKRIALLTSRSKAGDRQLRQMVDNLQILKGKLGEGILAKDSMETEADKYLVKDLSLLTMKPYMVLCNVGESDIGLNPDQIGPIKDLASTVPTVVLSAKIESEIAQIQNENEKREYLNSYSLKEPAFNHFLREAHSLLNLITFFTSGVQESRAWNIANGSTAPEAAGTIHTDFQKGFIKAEVIAYDDFDRLESEQRVKENGLLRIEGHDYIVQDGDVCHFRFNV
ncbi:MAG: redox-regulated ATPase YchF [Nitrospinota bacterium]